MTAKAVINIAVEVHDYPAIGVVHKYLSATARNDKAGALALAQLFSDLASGHLAGLVTAHCDAADGTQASSTLTVTQANATAADTVTVAGVVFTCTGSSTPSTNPYDGQFKAITSDDIAAAALKAAIDAHPKLLGTVETTILANAITVKSTIKTPVGNSISLASSDGTFVAVGAAKLASGATGTVVTGGATRGYRFGAA